MITAQERGINPYDGILFSWPPPPKEREEHKKNQYNTALQFIIKGLTDRRLPYDRGVLSALRLIDIQFSHRVGLNPVLFSQLAFVIFVSLILMLGVYNSTLPGPIFRERMPVLDLRN